MGAKSHTSTRQETRDHARAVKLAADFFGGLAKANDLPITPEDFEQRVADVFARLETLHGANNALLLAVLKDEPCPQSLFSAWASPARIWQWRNEPTDPLPAEELNGKICVRPTAFFRALRRFGSSKETT